MATALDLLMSTKEDVNLLSEESDICTIDAKTRAIFVPSTIVVGGVQSDKNAERIKFSCPKIVGDNLDLSKFSVRINFENVSSVDFNVSIKDQYICDDVAVDGENVTFSWLIGRNAARYMGTVRFIVCAVKTDSDSNISVEWNTAIAEVPVLEGIEIDQPQIGQEEKDVINQLLELTKNTSAEAVQNVNSAKEQAIKDIQSVSQPDTTLTIEGGLAEAKATGEAIASLKEDIEYFQDDVTKAFNATENLYNPHSFTNEKGIALTIADGTEYADSTTVNAITTGYFDTHEGDVWRFYRWNTAKNNIFPMEIRVFWFDENKKYISGAIINGDVTAPIRSRYLRFTEKFTLLYPELDVMVTKNFPFGVNDYEPYGFKQLKESFLPKETHELLQKSGTLHNGDSWVLENNNIMARKVFVLSGNVNVFSTLEMGHGTKSNTPSSWVVVDNENITVYSTPTNKVTLPHGLTITNTIQLIIEVETNYKAKITLVSNGEKYNTEQDWDGNIGNIFVNSINTELGDCTVSWTCKNYSSPIWAYGDSYFGMTNKARWIAQLLSNGYGTDMLIDGYPGRGSDDAYNSLQTTLKHGKPKYILWAMGMNNPDNESSVNKNWNNRFNDVKKLCEENDITLIGCTIPNTPTQFNSYKNNVVRNAGIKYIDFAKSVGAEHKGDSWYDGMLSSDNVHPTEKGAMTLYLQALADFPELASV
jgi:hypothetical protein